MARRSDHSKDELKELILTSAREIVKKEGYRELSARKVASKIGYTVGTLYNFFNNLDDLILHINARTLDMLYEKLESEISGCRNTKNIEDAVYKIGNSYIDFSYKYFHLWSMLFEHHFPRAHGHKLPKWFQNKIDKLFLLVEEAFLPTLKNNRKAASRTAKVFWASLHGICILSMTGKLDTIGAESAHTLVDSLIKIFISGIKRTS